LQREGERRSEEVLGALDVEEGEEDPRVGEVELGAYGGGLLEWGAHSVDLCQWANRADDTTPVEYEPQGNTVEARYTAPSTLPEASSRSCLRSQA
jgi:hypothetical protein